MDIYRYFRGNYDGHSKSTAYLLALPSLYIYKDHPPGLGTFESRFKFLFENLSTSDPFEIEIYNESGTIPYDTEVAILSNSSIVIVVFRGTEGPTAIKDWLTNAQHWMTAVPDSWGSGKKISVHKGYYNALSEVYQSVREIVRDRQQNGDRKVFLTGHSLGGALATLCAYRFQKVGGIDVSGVYTFGAPRVGDKEFSIQYSILHNKTFRWVNNDDFAAKMPDHAPPLPLTEPKYYHVGQLNHIYQNKSVKLNHGDFEPGPELSISDHNMAGYCAIMWNRLSNKERSNQSDPDWLVKGDVPLTPAIRK